MYKRENNFAFIDSQNLNLAIRSLGWQLDFGRFRKYLQEKYGVIRAYLFLGYIPENQKLYEKLQNMGYICIFKPTLTMQGGITKGNCDAELILHTMIHYSHFSKAVIVTGDGDFYCLVEYRLQNDKLKKLIIPNQAQYSALLRKFPMQYLAFACHLKSLLDTRKGRQ